MDKLLSGEINPEFINHINNKFLRNDSIFLICRSGARSHDAAIFYKKMVLIMFTMLLMGLKE